MVFEMNKANVNFRINFGSAKLNMTKIIMISIMLMSGTLLIPTNIHDVRANPCSGMSAVELVGTVPLVEILDLVGTVEMVEIREWVVLVGPGGFNGLGGSGGGGGSGVGSVIVKCTFKDVIINRGP